MNTKDFLNILSNPVQLQNEQIFEIEEILQQYPYFQAARALYLKGLKNINSTQYNQELKTTAAYTTDRSVLFHYITSDDFFDVNQSKQESKIISEIEIIDDKVIENLNKEAVQENKIVSKKKEKTSLDENTQKALSLTETSDIKDSEIDKEIKDDTSPLESNLPSDTTTNELEKSAFIEEKTEQLLFLTEGKDAIIENKDSKFETNPQDIEEVIETNTKQQIKTAFELDVENKIEPEIHEEEIEIYIESYSGELNKEEIRSLLEQYKTESKNPSPNTKDEKEDLLFEISTAKPEEVTDKIQTDSIQKDIENEVVGSESIDLEVFESTKKTDSNPYRSIFEFDKKESIKPTAEIYSDTTQEKSITEEALELYFEPIQEHTQAEYSENSISVTEELETEKEEIEYPIHFKKDDTHSFNDWLQLSSFKPIDRSISTIKKSKKEKNKELIDLFIDTNPKITPVKPVSKSFTTDLNKETITASQTVMTETLAQIYTEQKKYNNAIKAYEILSLKFPEKSSFFANQIKELKKLKQE